MSKKILIHLFLVLFFSSILHSQDKIEISFGSGTSNMSDISYKIDVDGVLFSTEIQKINNRFRDIDFKIDQGVYAEYIDMILGLTSSTITGLKIEIQSENSPSVQPGGLTITANKIMYSLDKWDIFIDPESFNRNGSLSNIKAKSTIDIQSVGLDIYPEDLLGEINPLWNLVLSKSSSTSNNIIIKKMIVDAEILNSKLIFNSKLDLVIGSADAAIEILLPNFDMLDESYILNFEIKMTRIDPDIATIIDASMLTLGLPIQKTSYGYLFKVVGTLDNPQPVIE
tara:strand:+ start:940 stop:1788 length:849 start_codon:yes stop_codon:yes gene_type:complete